MIDTIKECLLWLGLALLIVVAGVVVLPVVIVGMFGCLAFWVMVELTVRGLRLIDRVLLSERK